MSRNDRKESNQLVSADTKMTAVFVVFGVVLWYDSTAVTDSQPIQFALLLGVGIISPTLLNELR
jgi:hypothetical protein